MARSTVICVAELRDCSQPSFHIVDFTVIYLVLTVSNHEQDMAINSLQKRQLMREPLYRVQIITKVLPILIGDFGMSGA